MSSLTFLTDSTSTLPLLLTCAVVGSLLFLITKYIYRITFHPLAKFPGPRLAALTSLYGASYDLHPHRSYCKDFPALHDKYGPIVRLWPNQLHIRDIDAYNQIFKIGTKYDKHGPFYSMPYLKRSTFNITSTKRALVRKNMQSPLFSKEAVRRSEYLVTDMLAKFLETLSGYASAARPVDLTLGLRCLAADVSMNFGFQRPLNALDAPGFQSEVLDAAAALLDLFMWPINFPNFAQGVFWVTERLPKWFLHRFMKRIALLSWCLETSCEQIAYLEKRSASEKDLRTVFDINFHPNLEKGQFRPTVEEMGADAFTFLNAGTDTVSYTQVVITWGLLNNPQMLQRLKAELRVAMPHRDDTVDWAGLEKLPYLHAVIREGLRLSGGTPGRLPRVVPSTGAVFCGQMIPAGTLVSSSSYVYHHDLHTYKDPETFRPERWLAGEDPSRSDPREMDSKFLPFSRGSRMCTGLHLAYAELNLTLAHLFRRFEITNHGTSDADMEWVDCFAPETMGHLKVMLKESVD